MYPYTGRVEIFHNNVWGTVCDDNWDINDGKVVCRQLGFAGVSNVYIRAYFGEGSGQIWLDDVSCTGFEKSLSTCWSNFWGSHNCGHFEDAGVHCGSYSSLL